MSHAAATKKQLEKASYYFGECNSELTHVQGYAEKAGELVKEMGSLLLILGEDWSESAKKSKLNIGRADNIVSSMEAALQIMDPLHATLITSLAAHLMDARQGAKYIKEGSEDSLAAVTFWPLEGFSELSSQMTDDAQNLGRIAELSRETQQHYTQAKAACQEYKDIL